MEHVCQGFEGGGVFPYDDIWIDPCAVMKNYRTKPKSGGKPGETFQRVVPPGAHTRDSQCTSQGRRPPNGCHVVLGGSVIVASRELDEPKVFKVRKLADEMHDIVLGTRWV